MSDYDLSETYRKVSAMIRWGVVSGVDLSDPAAPRVTCSTGGLDTELIPWTAGRAGQTKKWSAPTVGEQVIVFAPGGETGLGFALGGFYSSDNPTPSTDPNVDMVEYPDGSTVQYDSGSNTLTVNVSGNGNVVVNCKVATVKAETSVTLDTPEATVTGNLTVQKNLGVVGAMDVQGQGASGGVSTFHGTINIQNGDVKADGIGLKTHKHPYSGSGGITDVGQG
jgi:phage baseplate assembly protein V